MEVRVRVRVRVSVRVSIPTTEVQNILARFDRRRGKWVALQVRVRVRIRVG